MKLRIVAAYENWIANRGHYTLLRIAQDMKVPYNDLVDYATSQIQSMFPDVQFEPKRPEIVPENDYVQMARLEAGACVSYHEQMTFDAFYYLANPKLERFEVDADEWYRFACIRSGGLELQNFQQTQNFDRITKLEINREARHFLYTLLWLVRLIALPLTFWRLAKLCIIKRNLYETRN